jgi:membrane protease YdiL (CAAX protease family)
MHNKMIIGENAIGGKRESIFFILITYLISWVSWGVLVLFGIPAKANALSTMLYLLGGLSPAIVAFVLPLFFGRAERGVRYKRFFKFKIPAHYYLLPIAAAALMAVVSYIAMPAFDANAASNLHIQPLYMIVPLFLSMVIGGGLEEFGWRGVLVYQLRKANPVFISLGVGLVWAVWHIPLFFLDGVGQYHANFLPFLITIIAYSLVLTPLSLKSGSVIPCILFHALANAFGELGFQYGSGLFTASMIDSLVKLGIGAAAFMVLNSKKFEAAQKPFEAPRSQPV